MRKWFQCKQCGQIFCNDILTVNRCPFCGHDYMQEVILKNRDVSPIYTIYTNTVSYQWEERKQRSVSDGKLH